MTKRSRTLLFITLVCVFFVSAPTMILFAQGYRFDFTLRQVVQVGGFYFDAQPTRAEVYIDGEKIGETTRFTGNSFFRNLLPKTYDILITKPGYTPWQKQLTIFPKQVTEAQFITLFPSSITFTSKHERVQKLWMAPNGRDILILNTAPPNKTWNLTLWDTQEDHTYPLIQPTYPNDRLIHVEWAHDSSRFLAHIQSITGTTQAYIHELDRNALATAPEQEVFAIADAHTTQVQLLPNQTLPTSFSPLDPTQLIILEKDKPGIIRFTQFSYTKAHEPWQQIDQNILAFTAHDTGMFWLDEIGSLWSFQQNQAYPIQYAERTITPDVKKQYNLLIFKHGIFLKENTQLFAFQESTNTFTNIANASTILAESPDHKKIAIAGNEALSLYFVQPEYEQPQQETQVLIPLHQFQGEIISDLQWINNHYLLYTLNDTVFITEVDTREPINVIEIASFPPLHQVFWQPSRVYIHADESISVSEPFWE